MPIASLESVVGRRNFRPFLEQGAADFAIVDLLWNGWLKALKIASMVESFEISCAPHTRVARAQTRAVKQEPYVEAAVAIGVATPMIILRHIVPNIAAPIVVLVTLWTASAIRLEASLSFLGIRTQPPNPSWGNITRDGLNNLFGSPWPIIAAGFAIICVVLAFNIFGESGSGKSVTALSILRLIPAPPAASPAGG